MGCQVMFGPSALPLCSVGLTAAAPVDQVGLRLLQHLQGQHGGARREVEYAAMGLASGGAGGLRGHGTHGQLRGAGEGRLVRRRACDGKQAAPAGRAAAGRSGHAGRPAPAADAHVKACLIRFCGRAPRQRAPGSRWGELHGRGCSRPHRVPACERGAAERDPGCRAPPGARWSRQTSCALAPAGW